MELKRSSRDKPVPKEEAVRYDSTSGPFTVTITDQLIICLNLRKLYIAHEILMWNGFIEATP